MASVHYAEHEGKPFFDDLVAFITRSPVVAMVVEGPDDTYKVVRTLMGATNPVEAAPGTIRGDLAIEMGENLIHGSDPRSRRSGRSSCSSPAWPDLLARRPGRPGSLGPEYFDQGIEVQRPGRRAPGRPCAHPPIPVA